LGDAEATVLREPREGGWSEVADVVGEAEAAPAWAADAAVEAGVVGDLDDDGSARAQRPLQAAKEEGGLGFVLEKGAEERTVERIRREGGDALDGAGLDDAATAGTNEGVGLGGEDAGDFNAMRFVARRQAGEDAAAAATNVEHATRRNVAAQEGEELVALEDFWRKRRKAWLRRLASGREARRRDSSAAEVFSQAKSSSRAA